MLSATKASGRRAQRQQWRRCTSEEAEAAAPQQGSGSSGEQVASLADPSSLLGAWQGKGHIWGWGLVDSVSTGTRGEGWASRRGAGMLATGSTLRGRSPATQPPVRWHPAPGADTTMVPTMFMVVPKQLCPAPLQAEPEHLHRWDQSWARARGGDRWAVPMESTGFVLGEVPGGGARVCGTDFQPLPSGNAVWGCQAQRKVVGRHAYPLPTDQPAADTPCTMNGSGQDDR